MANELTINWAVTFSKGGTEESFPGSASKAVNVSVTGSRVLRLRQQVTVTEVALNLGGIPAGGFLFGVNRSSSNYMSIRSGTGAANLVKLKPGEPCMFRFSATAPYVIADTATCEFEYLLVED